MTAWIVLGAIVSALLILLCMPVRLRIAAKDGNLTAKASYLWIVSKTLYPLPKRKKKKDKPTKSKAENKSAKIDEAEKKKKPLSRFRQLRALLASILTRMPATFSLEIRRLTVRIGTDDAAKTALLYGTVTSSLSFLLEWLDRHLIRIRRIKRDALAVYADFDADEIELCADLRLRTSLLRLLSLAVRALLPYFIKRIIKRRGRSAKTKKGAIPCQK